MQDKETDHQSLLKHADFRVQKNQGGSIEKLWRWLRQQVITMHRLAGDWERLRDRVNRFLLQFANGSEDLLHYVGLTGEGLLAQAIRAPSLPILKFKTH